MPSYTRTILKSENIVNIALETRGLDFREIVPRPAVETIMGETIDINLDIRSNNEVSDLENKDKSFFNISLQDHVDKLKKFLIEDGKLDRERFENYTQALKNVILTGHPSWLTWNLKNWNTKWNSSDLKYKDGEVRFDTAWYHPFPVIKKLSERFSDELFSVKYACESLDTVGFYEIKNGKKLDIEDGKKSTLFACEVWGYSDEDTKQILKEENEGKD